MSLEQLIMKHEKLILLNDIHIPFEDKQTLQSVYSGIKYTKPDTIILGGDIVDFYSISRFDKDPQRRLRLETEIEPTKEFLANLRKIAPNSKIIYLEGNHEERLQKYINHNAPELAWVKALQLERILNLEEYGIKYVKKRWIEYKGVIYSHMDKANKYGGYTAKNIGVDLSNSVVHTHSHKVGHVQVADRHFYDNGCLCEMQADYLTGPSMWGQAIMMVDYVGKDIYFTQIPIQDHKFLLDGRLFTPEGVIKIGTQVNR